MSHVDRFTRHGRMTLVDTEVAAYVLQVTPRRIRQLVADGSLTNHGTDRQFALDLDAISRLAKEKQQR